MRETFPICSSGKTLRELTEGLILAPEMPEGDKRAGGNGDGDGEEEGLPCVNPFYQVLEKGYRHDEDYDARELRLEAVEVVYRKPPGKFNVLYEELVKPYGEHE